VAITTSFEVEKGLDNLKGLIPYGDGEN